MTPRVLPTRGKAGSMHGPQRPLSTIGSPCATLILARSNSVAPPKGRRYECRRDPPDAPRLEKKKNRCTFTRSRSPDTPSALRFWNLQISADLSGEEVVDLAVPRHRGALAGDAIQKDRMPGTFALQLAPVLFEMANQVGTLQRVTVKGSRITSAPFRSSSSSERLISSTRA